MGTERDMTNDNEAIMVKKRCLSMRKASLLRSEEGQGHEDNVEVQFPGGSRYVGSMYNGHLSGHGIYYYASSGDKYEGDWEADMKHGHGTYTYGTGDRYVGNWCMGRKHYRGTYYFANGDQYTGFWKDDKINGYGVLTIQSSGDRYEGHWKDSYRHRHGVFYHGNGDVYDGNWVRGKQEGLGIFIQANGNVYCGEWKGGKMNGKGIVRDQNILFAVEYTESQATLQLPIPEDTRPDSGWSEAYDHYVAYMGKYQRYGNRTAVENDELRSALLKLKVENALLEKRYKELQNEQLTTNQVKVNNITPRGNEVQLQLPSIQKRKNSTAEHCLGLEAERYFDVRSIGSLSPQNADETDDTRSLTSGGDTWSRQMPSEVDNSEFSENMGHRQKKKGHHPKTKVLRSEIAKLRYENAKLMERNSELESRCTGILSEKEELERTLLFSPSKAEESMEKSKKDVMALEQEQSREALILSHQGKQPEKALTEKNLSDGRLTPGKPQSSKVVDDLNERFKEVSRANAELQVSCDWLEKQLEEQRDRYQRLVNKINVPSSGEEVLQFLQMEVQRVESQLRDTEKDLQKYKLDLRNCKNRCIDLESSLLAMSKEKATDPKILRSLGRKMDLTLSLQEANAELARVLEETKMRLEISLSNNKVLEERWSSLEGDVSVHRDELRRARKELKKEQNRCKRMLAEKDAIVTELREKQVKLTGSERILKNLEGSLIVFIRVQNSDETTDSIPCVRINEKDTSQVVLKEDDGNQKVYPFDICVDGKTNSLDNMFHELCRPMMTVPMGFHVAYVTLGGVHTGKTEMFNKLIPSVIKSLRDYCQGFSSEKYSVTYKVGALIIDASGAVDCDTGSAVTEVRRDSYGISIPLGVAFVETTNENLLSTMERLRERQQNHRRSHIWIQIECTILHRVRRTSTVGRLTLVDLSGPGPLPKEKEEVRNTRFVNRSFRHLMTVLRSLQDRQGVVPYTDCLETTLLSDVFGGNALTTILGALSSAEEDISETQQTLQALKMATEVMNGPLLPRFVTSEELRLREVIAATHSAEMALPQLLDVDGLRDV